MRKPRDVNHVWMRCCILDFGQREAEIEAHVTSTKEARRLIDWLERWIKWKDAKAQRPGG